MQQKTTSFGSNSPVSAGLACVWRELGLGHYFPPPTRAASICAMIWLFLKPFCSMAPDGQAATQVPQPMHSPSLTTAFSFSGLLRVRHDGDRLVLADRLAYAAAVADHLVHRRDDALGLQELLRDDGHCPGGRSGCLCDGLIDELRPVGQSGQVYAVGGEVDRPQLHVRLEEVPVLAQRHLQHLGQLLVVRRWA